MPALPRIARPSRRSHALLAAAAAALLPLRASADTRTYVGPASGTFSFGSNWSPTGVPGPDDDALISPAAPTSAYSITFNTVTPYQLNSLTLNSPSPTKPLTFNLYPSYITQTSQFTAAAEVVGSTGAATLVQSEHSNFVSTLSIADSAGSSGTYRLNGGLLSADTAYVGRAGSGTLSVPGGTLAVTNLYLADAPGAYATFSQSGAYNISTNIFAAAAAGSSANVTVTSGSLTPASLYVGYAGSATFAQSGGNAGRSTSQYSSFPVASSTSVLLGYNSGSSGTYLLSNGYLYDALAYVGFSGTGSLVQTGGYHTVASNLTGTVASVYLGYNPGSSGTYTLSAGTLATPSLVVGYSGAGSFAQSGTGTLSLTNYSTPSSGIYLGYNPGSSGTYSFSSPFLLENSAYVGFSGAGTFAQTAGSHSIADTLFVAYAPGSAGLYSLAGGTLHASTLFVGYNGAGTFSQSAGSVSAAYGIFIGNNASPGSSYLLSGGTLSNSPTLSVGNGGPGTLSQTGGSVSGTGYLYVGNAAPGSYTLSAGSLSAGNEYVGTNGGRGTFTQTGGTHSANVLALAYTLNPPFPSTPGSASYSLSAGSLAVSYEYLGYDGPATFTQTGGTHTIANGLYLGSYDSAGQALYKLSAGTLSASGETFGSNTIPNTPFVTFLQTGGTNITNSIQPILGSYSLSGGTLSIGSPLPATPNTSFAWSWTGGSLLFPNGYTLSTNHSFSSPIASPLTLSPSQTLSGGSFASNPTASSLILAGGTLAGTGSFSNSGSVTGHGTVATGSFTNSATLALTGGPTLFSAPLTNTATLTLANAAATFTPTVTSYGSISLTNSSASFPNGLTTTPSLNGSLTLDADSSLTAQFITQGAVTSAGSITLLSPTPASALTALTLLPTAKFDLANNPLTLASPDLSAVRQYLAGGQLFSSAADATHALTYVTFTGTSKIQFTLALLGDANLDHRITADDYALLDRSLARNVANARWTDGDFNYDGQVTSADYLLLDTAYLQQQGGSPSPAFLSQRESQFGEAYVADLLTSIPEPSSLACLSAGILLARRTRRRA